MRKKDEQITNVRRVTDRVIEGEMITEFEIEIIDWEEHLQEHRERIETETENILNQIENREIKEKSCNYTKNARDS